MAHSSRRRVLRARALQISLLAAVAAGGVVPLACSSSDNTGGGTSGGPTATPTTPATPTSTPTSPPASVLPGAAGPTDQGANQFVHPTGDVNVGRDVFRFETFGNEGFWTRVLQLPQGMKAAGVTPLQALALGISVDIEKVPAAW